MSLMRLQLAAAALWMFGAFGISQAALAQDNDRRFLVTYLEVAPNAATAAGSLILRYCDAARGAPGLLNMHAFKRVGRANQFALLAAWQSGNALQEFAAGDASKRFVAGIEPLRIAGYDERVHAALSIAASAAASVPPVLVLTHVDIIPTFKDAGVAKVKEFVAQSRTAAGNLRFDALTPTSRPNHMTIVEGWSTRAAKDMHIASTLARSFRESLLPMSGSLYDERIYASLQ
jgi:quinol monooxygenase YgiN